MRVNQTTYYRTSTAQLMRYQVEMSKLSEQISTGSTINRPSDDPVSMITVQNAQVQLDELTQYTASLKHAKTWLSQASSDFSQVSSLIQQAATLAEQMATGTMDADNRQAAAETVKGIIGDLILLCNSEISGTHIYAGTAIDDSAVTSDLKVASMAEASDDNIGDGDIYAFGDYTGLMSRDITITADSTVANRFEISYIDDYGRTRTSTVDLAGSGAGNAVEICDGVTIYLDSGSFEPGDSYTLSVGRQQGNTSDLLVNLSTDNRLDYNYTADQFMGDEGNDGDGWSNLLDILTQWAYYLERDGQDHDYYEAVPGVGNNAANDGTFQVSGDWDTLASREYEFMVGGPLSSDASESDLSHFSNFTVDSSWSGGVPSEDNPMIISYDYDGAFGGVAAGTYQIVVTGVGDDYSYELADGGVSIDLMDAYYSGSGQSYELSSSFANGSSPSESNPMTVTYTYLDNNGVRRMGTTTFTGTGADNEVTLDPSGDGVTVTLSDDATFDMFDSFDLTLEQYNQGERISQELLETLDESLTTVLKYEADAGAKLNRLEVRMSFFEEDALRLNDRFEALADADIATVTAEWELLKVMYQAALAATSMVSTTSLADYL